MPFRTIGAFTAGVAVGWAARSGVGSTREALVRVVVAGYKVREVVRDHLGRGVVERIEWAQDLFAEGRALYDASRDQPPLDDDAPPRVVAGQRERAA